MKKTLLTIGLSLTVIAGAFAQGQINFNNTAATLGRTAIVTFSDSGLGVVGQNYVAQLFYAGSAVTSAAAVSEAPSLFRIPTTSNPGTWSGGARTLTQASGTVNLVVRVWDSSLYSSYAEASVGNAGFFGESSPFSYDIPTGNPAPSQLVMNNFQGFAINPAAVPEPTTIALGILGAGSLVFLRRKK